MSGKNWKVYTHINKKNGKQYIGITSKEKPEHRWNGGRGYVENPHFYAAILKYGWDGFEHVILCDGLTAEEAEALEIKLIKELKTQDRLYGYNVSAGGQGTPGVHPSEETRKKLSKARLKENLSQETLQRRSAGLRGRKFSEEHKKKIGMGNSKAINMFSKNGALVESFTSAREVEVKYGISHSHISQCCHGHRQTAGGYIWRFA